MLHKKWIVIFGLIFGLSSASFGDVGAKKIVSFGFGAQRTSKSFEPGNYVCSIKTFGNDPAYGHTKYCYLNDAVIAGEGQPFSTLDPVVDPIALTVTLRGSDDDYYAAKKGFAPGIYICSNETFGLHPVFDYPKVCSAEGIVMAQVGQTFSVPNWGDHPHYHKTVSFGNGPNFVSKAFFPGIYVCSANTFGYDASASTEKTCVMDKETIAKEGQIFQVY